MSRLRKCLVELSNRLKTEPALRGRALDHVLLSMKYRDGHIHTAYPDQPVANELVRHMAMEKGLNFVKTSDPVHKKRKIILKQRQSPGDILTMTRAVADLAMTYPEWEIDVRCPCPEIWEHCPHLTPLDEKDPDVEAFDIGYPAINESGWRGLHFTDAFREDMEQQLGVAIKKTGYKPDLWIADIEKTWINQVEAEFGWRGPFWLLNAGRKQDNELKHYHRWQEVVDRLNIFFQNRVQIVQIGHGSHLHPKLHGVLSLVGKTDVRQLIRLAWWAHGTIGPLSFQFVISAALEQPHVVVAAGKEGVPWHLYPHGRYIYTNGALECCGWDGCWLGGAKGQCKDLVETRGEQVPRCMTLIRPHQIADAVAMYYEGGRLSWERGK